MKENGDKGCVGVLGSEKELLLNHDRRVQRRPPGARHSLLCLKGCYAVAGGWVHKYAKTAVASNPPHKQPADCGT